jgi:ATPase subunit of ABC transporter with duplicated ATPase domains
MSSNILSLSAVKKSYGEHRVLAGVSFSIAAGERVGLVGPNGVGKSTILKIAAGLVKSDSGSVQLASGAKLVYLGQELPLRSAAVTVSDYLAENGSGEISGMLLGWCAKLGLSADFMSRELVTLSGGEKSRLGLVLMLASGADVVLLDEPTNNLDLAGLVWLEKAILVSKAAFVVVSHDRKFLDRITTRTLELDEATGVVRQYDGGFSEYLAERERRLQNAWAKYEDYKGEVRRLKQSAIEKKNWAERGAAQKTSDNDKFVRGKARDYAAGKAAVAKAIEKRLARIEEVDEPFEHLPMKLSFEPAERGGDAVFSVSNFSISVDEKTFGPLDFNITNGERIAILGPNGIGKSLLLKALVGEIEPVTGSILRGTGLALGYLPQEPLRSASHNALAELGEALTDEGRLRRTLHRFRIDAKDVVKPVADLSPGQRSRLILAKLMLHQSNCLVLDEPSNHLDLEAMEALEGALSEFKGTAIVVTHDRYFLDRFKPTRTLWMEGNWRLREIADYTQKEIV